MLLKINKEMLADSIASMGAHPESVPIFNNKCAIIPFKATGVRTPAANIIKQELLAAGGDCITPLSCITCSEKYVDILLLGTRKHYNILLKKMEQMPYFGIPALEEKLRSALGDASVRTTLADGRVLEYEKLCVMGILNITPDSFYAGSRVPAMEAVMQRASEMLEQGADILDIGGESTRPGSDSVDAEEEMARVIPVIKALREKYPEAILSVDTYRASTARAAIEAGADIINDITAMEGDPAMADLVVESNAPIILMHMRGTPKNMQQNCEYRNVVVEVAAYLEERAQILRDCGVGADKIILDPGIGFAKSVKQNLLLMRDLHTLTSFGYPVLLAASRKSSLGAALGGIPAEDRLEATIATSLQAVYAGAQIIRVHDVQENLRAVRMLEAMQCPKDY